MVTTKIKKYEKAMLSELHECFDSKLKIKVKDISSNNIYDAVLQKYDVDNFIIKFLEPVDQTDLIKLIQKDLLGTVFHHDKILGFTFKIALFNEKFAICNLPIRELYSLDTRKEERLHIDPSLFSSIRALFTIDEKLTPYIFNIYDISSEGFSILVPIDHMCVIKINKEYNPINIRLLGTQITLVAEARNVFQLANKPNFFKIGFKISKISTTHKNVIEEYINKHVKIKRANI